MSSVWDRRNRRISYQVPVGVVDLKKNRVLNTSSINVSRGGMFVDTDQALPIGSPIVCNLPFGRDQEAMQLRGRVAWLRSPSSADTSRPGGVGIEFVDLSDSESDQLSDIVGGNREQSHVLSLRLQGMASPVRGEAHLTPKGLFFRSQLPFLAIDSEVGICFPEDNEEQTYEGRIVGVDVYEAPGSSIPRLQVEVAVHSDELPDRSDIPSGEGDSGDLSYDMLQIDVADTEKTVEDSELLPVAIPQMLPIVTAPMLQDAVVQEFERPEETERIRKSAQSVGRVWPATAVLVGCILGILAFAFSGDDKTPVVVEAKDEASASDQVRALIEAPAQERAAEQHALERIRAAASNHNDELEIEFAAVTPQPEAQPQNAPASVSSETERIGGATISEAGELVVIRLPIEGSLERAADYRLANPPGIAVNLPYAKPRAGFHQSLEPKHEHLRALWVRERLGGLHFRVSFSQEMQSCEVKYQPAALVIRCQP